MNLEAMYEVTQAHQTKWGQKVQSGVRSFSGVRRFKAGVEDSKWGQKIESGVTRLSVELDDSKWVEKIRSWKIQIRGQKIQSGV